jgi:hypothetical protein
MSNNDPVVLNVNQLAVSRCNQAISMCNVKDRNRNATEITIRSARVVALILIRMRFAVASRLNEPLKCSVRGSSRTHGLLNIKFKQRLPVRRSVACKASMEDVTLRSPVHKTEFHALHT